MANISSYLVGTFTTSPNTQYVTTDGSNIKLYPIINSHDFTNITTDIFYSANSNFDFSKFGLFFSSDNGDTGLQVQGIETDIQQAYIEGDISDTLAKTNHIYTFIGTSPSYSSTYKYGSFLNANICSNVDYSKLYCSVTCCDINGQAVNIDDENNINTLVYISNILVKPTNKINGSGLGLYFVFEYQLGDETIYIQCDTATGRYSSADRWYQNRITYYNDKPLYFMYTPNPNYNGTTAQRMTYNNNLYYYRFNIYDFGDAENLKRRVEEIRVNASQYGYNYALGITPLMPVSDVIKILNATGLKYMDESTYSSNDASTLRNLFYIGHMNDDGTTDCNKRYQGETELYDSDSLNKYYTSYNTLTPPPENVTPLPADIEDNLVNNELNNITIENKFLRYYLINDIDQFRIAVDNKRDQNPLQYLVSLNMIPDFLIPYMLGVPTTDGIQMGNVPIAYNAVIVNNVRATFNVGNINVTPYYNNFMDYAPYTQAYLYIPYFELIQLDVNKCMNKNLSIEIGWDYETGDAISYIKSNGSLVTTKRANFYSSQIISADNHTRKMMTILGSIGTGIVGTAVGIGSGNLLTIAGSIGAAVTGYQQGLSMNSRSTVGSIGTATSFTMPKIPTLYMVRPRAKIPENYKSEKGYMSFKNGVLSNFHGFTSCLNPHIDIPTATDTEKNMIENLLQTGIILP